MNQKDQEMAGLALLIQKKYEKKCERYEQEVSELKARIKQLCEENLSITKELHCGKQNEIFMSFQSQQDSNQNLRTVSGVTTQQNSSIDLRPASDKELLKTKEEEIAMLWNMVKKKSKSVLRDYT